MVCEMHARMIADVVPLCGVQPFAVCMEDGDVIWDPLWESVRTCNGNLYHIRVRYWSHDSICDAAGKPYPASLYEQCMLLHVW